jgi:hypothetical protein
VEGESQGDSLLRVLEQLLDDLPDPGAVDIPSTDSTFEGDQTRIGNLGPEDEVRVRGIRTALARIAVALDPRREGEPTAVRAVLDGAETIIRGELVTGRGDRLPRLLPSLVFLVALPIVEQDRALELAHRAAVLIGSDQGPRP